MARTESHGRGMYLISFCVGYVDILMRRLGHCGFVVSLVVPGTAVGSSECSTDAYIIATALYSFQHISSQGRGGLVDVPPPLELPGAAGSVERESRVRIPV